MVITHPALDVLSTLIITARGDYNATDCQKVLAHILRKVIKRPRYECWGVIISDRGDVPVKDNPGVFRPYITLHSRKVLANFGACPECGCTDWGHIYGNTFMCKHCYRTYRIKEARLHV